jgi:hypothetical protein
MLGEEVRCGDRGWPLKEIAFDKVSDERFEVTVRLDGRKGALLLAWSLLPPSSDIFVFGNLISFLI